MKKVIGKNIVIKAVDEEIKTDFGMVLSGDDVKMMRYKKGIIVMPGTDVSTVSEGDEIYYDKSNSFTMVINDEQYTVIRELDIVVVL
jgi:co-chaperonin GroES (HSP10)